MNVAGWPARTVCLIAICVPVAACSRPTPRAGPAAGESGGPLDIVAVSPVMADVVRQVAPAALVHALAPLGDPAAYQPSEEDVARAAAADLVVATAKELQALGLQGAQAAGPTGQGPVNFLIGAGGESEYPWLDPRAVAGWVTTLAESLASLDPAGATGYRDAAERYARELAVASGMLLETAKAIPVERRSFLTDAPEAAAGLARALDADAIPRPLIAGVTSVAAADAQGVEALADAVSASGDAFVFLVAPGNQSHASEIADAAGRPVGLLFLVSPTGPDGPAPDYLSMMRFNAESLMEGLGSQEPPTVESEDAEGTPSPEAAG